jgi:hypothetical protein
MKLAAFCVILAVLGLAFSAFAQRGRFRGGPSFSQSDSVFPKDAEFHFLRMEYTDAPGFRRGFGFVSRGGEAGGWWAQDWPDAEEHFTTGIGRLTRIQPGEPAHMRVTDERIFNYPWIYATQTGNWDLSQEEVERMREFLLRGGYLVVDDMWGAVEWENFVEAMQRVLPDKPIQDLEESDTVMHVLYDIKDKDRTFIPGSRHLYVGPGGKAQIYQPPGTSPAWRAIYDDQKHMVVAINFDTDVADAWEFADVPYYPEAMTTLAYRYGINYVIYSMTH